MRLTKLDVVGFKSFARKTELAFGGGITAVIGPNGSGKSNIADAVRWVLGEQSAKALRGSKMEDVIFGGTQLKKALSYCEVTLTFDNSDHLLPVDFNEVAITRRVYRSGESEYCINKNNCRLRDVQDLFHDTGIGKDGYSIIGQGKVDDILSNKTNDRRTALEEAAGVMRFRVRKEEAERKLDHTEKNLERLEDILFELQGRIGPLEEQSRTAREFLKLRDELKDQEINVFLYQSDRMHDRLKSISEVIDQLKQEEVVDAEREQAVLSECAELEERIKKLDASIADQQRELMELLSGVETRVGECNVLIERRDNAKAERARAEESRSQIEEKRLAVIDELQTLQDEAGEAESIARLDAELDDNAKALAALDAKITSDETALEKMKSGIIEAMNRLSDAKSLLAHFETMQGALNARIDDISREIEGYREKGERLIEELNAAERDFQQKLDASSASENALKDALREQGEAQQKFQARGRERDKLNNGLVAMQSRLNALNDLAKSREGYFESVRLVMRDTARNPELKNAIVGVVAELISVPKQYEQAVSMTLGSSLQNIVTETPEDAKFVIDYLRKNDYGRATLLPLNLLRISHISDAEKRNVTGEGVIGFASELITYDPRIDNAVRFLLGRTVVVRDLESGIRLKKKTGNSFHIATLDGDIISTGGSMSGGSQKKRSFSLLGREREIQELTETLKKGEDEKKQFAAETQKIERELFLYETQIEAFRTKVQDCRIEETKQREKTEIVSRDLKDNQERIAKLEEEQQGIRENIEDLVHERDEANAAQSGIEAGNAATREDVSNAQRALSKLRAERETLVSAISDRRVRRMAYLKERDAKEREKKRLLSEQTSAARELAVTEEKIKTLTEQIDVCKARLDEMQRSVEREQNGAAEHKKLQQEAEDERAGLNEQLSKLRFSREGMLVAARDRAERIHKQELSVSRLEMELTSMQDHIWEEYALTYENALPFRRDISVSSANARISEIKSAVKELGEINLTSIEDYKTVSERFESMTVQRDDLRMAKTDLENMIVDLTATMEREFKEKFDLIQNNFANVFVELFGGGYAELRLADPNDALNCDIDIIAQPPGKKLQLLSLLSGGERAMTAIALLFAMLRIKPPAFCVLDEIESSLDEANVARFADFLKAYSHETQFIIITHRRGSMAVCDTLYGVSMEEKGVSRIVSARFEEVSNNG